MVATEEEASPQRQNWQGEEESWYASGDADVCLNTPDVCYTVGLCAAVDFLLGVAGILIDSECNRRERYLLLQWRLSESDSVDGLYATFTNVYEKGYCAEKVVLRTGQQLIIQSEWVKNDKKFGCKKTKLSASVGSERSGNEGG